MKITVNDRATEILAKIDEKPKKGIKCKNHPDTQATVYCSLCEQPFCEKCSTQHWRPNFINNVFTGSKEKFVKETLCEECAKKTNRSQVLSSCALLFLILSIIMFFIIGSI